MKRIVSLTVIFSVMFLAVASIAIADVPTLMQYQGFLTDESGEPLDTIVSMTFTIYSNPYEPIVVWTETQDSVSVIKGLFNVLMGSVNLIPDTVFAESDRWLGITVGNDPEIEPWTRLVTVPYAFRVSTIDGASGGGVFGDVYLHSTLTVGSLEEADPGRIEVTDGVDPVIIADGANKQVSIGLIDPNGQFHVETYDYPYSASFTSFYPNAQAKVIKAEHLGTGDYDAVAVYGSSTPADYYGYGGFFKGGKAGVCGQVFPTGSHQYYGVLGQVYGGSGWNFGLYGQADGSGGNVGVQGFATGDSLNYGVRGLATDSLGIANYGVYGFASGILTANYGVYGLASGSGGTANYGVYGEAPIAAGYWAGYFDGDVTVTGTLSKGGGGFKIDHPLDPENKYLYHSFVESPDMMNVYNGNVVLNANGEATVELPDYFGAVNEDFRYQLTPIGTPGPNLHIAEKISNNRFKIAGGESGMEVSWQVTGIRKDPFAQANRIQVEVDKPAKEQGKYLHPEAYGLGEEYDIHYEQHKLMKELQEKSAPKMEQR